MQPDRADAGAVLVADVEGERGVGVCAVVEIAADGRRIVTAFGLGDISVDGVEVLKRAVQMDAARRFDHLRLVGRPFVVLVHVVHAEVHADDAAGVAFIAVLHGEVISVVTSEDVDGRAAPLRHAVRDVIAFAVDVLDLLSRIAETDAAELHLLICEPCCTACGGKKEEREEQREEECSDFHVVLPLSLLNLDES